MEVGKDEAISQTGCWLTANSANLGLITPGFKFLHHRLPVLSWASHLVFGPQFPICRMGIIALGYLTVCEEPRHLSQTPCDH